MPQDNINHVTYMGAYSLTHWIDKILHKEILLPPYQRVFVWDWEKEGQRFAGSLDQKLYIPSVTLCDYKDETYLIDGQQRITTILCLKYRIWPTFELIEETDDEDESLKSSEFTFEHIQKNDAWKETLMVDGIIRKLTIEEIKTFENLEFNDSFIPYNHIIWKDNTTHEIQESFYAKVFDRINTGGQPLSNKDVREATYWMYSSLKPKVYQEEFEKNISIDNNPFDYVEYLAIMCNYKNNDKKLFYKSRRIEKHIGQYISDFLNILTIDTKDLVINTRWNKDITNSKITKDNYITLKKIVEDLIPLYNHTEIEQKEKEKQDKQDEIDSINEENKALESKTAVM